MHLLKEISENIIEGNDEEVKILTERALTENISYKQILEEGLIAGMNVVGARFKEREIFLPDVLMAAKAMQQGLDLIKPYMVKEGLPTLGKVIVGSVQGDLHDIGKNLVSTMLKGAGFEVIDLGHDVSPDKFIETAKSSNASVIGMSALLTTTMSVMKEVCDRIKQENLPIKVIVGGAPVSAEFAKEIGADGYGYDGANAVEQVKKLL